MVMLGRSSTAMDICLEVCNDALSVTCAVKEDTPTPVGVPEMMPLAARDKPVGREPAVSVQV